MGEKKPLHVSDATIAIAAGCHGCGGTILVDYVLCTFYSLVAFSINKKRTTTVTTAPLAVEIPLIAS
jgi:hypothetical protein